MTFDASYKNLATENNQNSNKINAEVLSLVAVPFYFIHLAISALSDIMQQALRSTSNLSTCPVAGCCHLVKLVA